MAKKKSTATKTAITASEPRVMSMRQWSGINVNEKAPGWNPIATYQKPTPNQADLQDNFLMVQNNCLCTVSKAIETRDDDELIATAPKGTEFTGVCCLQQENLICAFTDGSLRVHVLGDEPDKWTSIPVTDPDGEEGAKEWTEIGYYQSMLICFSTESECFVGPLSTMTTEGVSSALRIGTPSSAPTLTPRGDLKTGDTSRIQVSYTYTNIFGQTLNSPWKTIEVNLSPVEWSASAYLRVSGTAPTGQGITGVDVYFTMDDNVDASFAGHVTLTDGGKWTYNWLGALADTSQWTNSPLTVPTENTTKGVNAQYMTHIDGRLYFWGGDDKYRLWIGGNPGNELSVARGTGGAFVDIEPGTGTEVTNVLKYKTYSASSIVTIMCGNPNTEQVKRFNLLETNVTITNEVTSKGYMTEEVSNVMGCNSRWGSAVFEDGLYAVNRYGLGVTTQAMEYNNQLRVNYVSDQLAPIFTDRLGMRLNNCRLVYINGVAHIVLASDEDDALDPVIMCYDVSAKAWWTYTYGTDEKILHVMAIDSQAHQEGVGVVTPTKLTLIPTTGPKLDTPPNFGDCYLETGELSVRLPPNESMWLEQIEIDFDYFVGDMEIAVLGVDYYGREFRVIKQVTWDDMVTNLQEWIRVGMIVRTYHLEMRGPARFRLFQILQKTYSQSSKINLVYGLDAWHDLTDANGHESVMHHDIGSYNDLRAALVT